MRGSCTMTSSPLVFSSSIADGRRDVFPRRDWENQGTKVRPEMLHMFDHVCFVSRLDS